MKHLKYNFIEDQTSGMVVFRGGGVTALVPAELRFDALSILYGYSNSERAMGFANEILCDQFDNPFFGMPEDELISLATSLKSDIAAPWKYIDIDIESNFSAVVNFNEPNGCLPVVTVKGKKPTDHFAMLAAFDKIASLRAKITTYKSRSHVEFFRSEKNISYLGFETSVDDTSKYVQTLIFNRKPPLSFVLAIPSSYDLWSSMHDQSTMPDIKLLDFCTSVPVTLTKAVVSKSDFQFWKPKNSFRKIIESSGQRLTSEKIAAAVA